MSSGIFLTRGFSPLEFFQSGDLILDELVPLLVDVHQLIPIPLQGFRMEIPVQGFTGVPQLAFNIPEIPNKMLTCGLHVFMKFK